MAAREFQENLIAEVTENIRVKYTQFINELDRDAEKCHRLNAQFIDNSIEIEQFSYDVTIIERTQLLNIIKTCGNMQMNRVFLVLGSLCQEMNQLSQIGNQRFVCQLSMYSEGKGDSLISQNENDDLKSMSKFLEILYNLMCYLQRCYDVAKNFIQQLQQLYPSKIDKRQSRQPLFELNGAHFNILFQYLGDLCVTLINIEDILINQIFVRRDFVNYKRIIELVNNNYCEFDVANENQMKIRVLYGIISRIEKEVIDENNLLKHFIDSMVNSVQENSLPTNVPLCEQFIIFLRNAVTFFESDENRYKDPRKFLAISAVFVLYSWLFRKDDKKLYKVIYECQRRTSVLLVHLSGNCTIIPEQFFVKHLPKVMIQKKVNDQFAMMREALLKVSIAERVKNFGARVNSWLIRFERIFEESEDHNLVSLVSRQIELIEDGLDLIFLCSNVVRNSIYQHLFANKAMSKADLIGFCRLMAMVKAVEMSFERRRSDVMESLDRMIRYMGCVLLDTLSLVKKRLLSEVKKYSEKKLDVISALILAANCVYGPMFVTDRQILSGLCLSIVEESMSENESRKILNSFKKMKSCSLFWRRLHEWACCDYIYYSRSLVGIYFSNLVGNCVGEIFELNYFFRTIRDCEPLILKSFDYDCERRDLMLKQLQDDIHGQFREFFLDRLCTEIENELRIQVHSDLKLDDQNPFRRPLSNFSVAMECDKLRLFNKVVPIRGYVENYLNEIAYNLTTIALHDWKTYELMLSLARANYGLEFVTSQLPMQTLEQGLDLLEITRNIHVFVSRYVYNLNNQMFIERSSENKHLNVLLIRHVANSIQTHGFGVINTAVNFTYQFLKKKFAIFSQFLYEDPIKSRLNKDIKYFREQKLRSFPYEKAETLVKGIRKLGLNEDGLTFLDQFRLLISEIGNALGFVRMLRSGALHCSSMSVSFVPDLEDIGSINFRSMLGDLGVCGEEACESATNLDTVLTTLNRNFSEASDYLQLLVQVFQRILCDKDNYHLRNFFVILPALTLNYIEYIMMSKEKMTRKDKTGAGFTDDGFAMGVAYCLKLLRQHNDFDSLQWFQSIDEKIKKEMDVVKEKMRGDADVNGERMTQTIVLTEKRLNGLRNEFDLLNYSLTSCRILFKVNLDC